MQALMEPECQSLAAQAERSTEAAGAPDPAHGSPRLGSQHALEGLGPPLSLADRSTAQPATYSETAQLIPFPTPHGTLRCWIARQHRPGMNEHLHATLLTTLGSTDSSAALPVRHQVWYDAWRIRGPHHLLHQSPRRLGRFKRERLERFGCIMVPPDDLPSA
jgi:hypothetical protein